MADDDKIFTAPLGQAAEDAHNSGAPAREVQIKDADPPEREEKKPMSNTPSERDRDRRSLQDLVKLAQFSTPPPPSSTSPDRAAPAVERAAGAKADDSGLVNLAALTPPPPETDAVAGPSAALGTGSLFEEDAGPSNAPASALGPSSARPAAAPASVGAPGMGAAQAVSAGRISVPPSSGRSSVVPLPLGPAPSVAPPASKKGGTGLVTGAIGGLVILAAVAAGGFMFVRVQLQKAEQKLAQAMKTEAPVVAMAEDKAAPQSDTPSTVETAPGVTDPSPTVAQPRAAAFVAKGPLAAATGAKPDKDKKEEPQEEGKMSAKDLPQAAGSAGSLNDAMKQAAGPSSAGDKKDDGKGGPQYAAGSVPQRPSQGALTGAINVALPGARGCLGPDDPVSRATVVFASAGNVQSVTVSGAAAGKPAEGCIKAALMKAKVPPFAEATFTFPVTVRPH